MLEVLARWNRWGTNALESGLRRDITARIMPYVDNKAIIPLMGSRRAGKSTVLYQVMDGLLAQGVPEKAMLHINFEEPKLTSKLTVEGLDALYDTYREHVYPEGKAYVFLDEIQNVLEWERWVRARNKTENIKIFLTGSSAKLMSGELATLLTGRHLSFEVMPLSFSEYLRFLEVPLPKHQLPIKAPASILNALNDYLAWGGYPEVILAKTLQEKTDVLLQYFDDILYKDIVMRHSIRSPLMLRNIAVHALMQTGKLVSFQGIAKFFKISNDLAVHYCRYLQEAFLVDFLPFFSLKTAVRQRNPQKLHALDVGLRNCVSLSNSKDNGHVVETLVYQTLKRRHADNVFYWKGDNEIDFVVHQNNQVIEVWQVVLGGLEEPSVKKREKQALLSAKAEFPKAKHKIVTKDFVSNLEDFPFEVVPLWSFLLGTK